jgi:hypothetical protein
MSDESLVDVPAVVQQLLNQVMHLQKHVLAYGELLRGQCPIVTWPAHINGEMQEIMTDLSLIPEEQVQSVMGVIAQVHATGTGESLVQCETLLRSLRVAMSAPSPATQPEPQPEPAATVVEQPAAAPVTPAAPSAIPPIHVPPGQ